MCHHHLILYTAIRPHDNGGEVSGRTIHMHTCMLIEHLLQILLCRRAEDVILVTLNHLDTIRALVGDSDNHSIMLNSACKTVGNVSTNALLYSGVHTLPQHYGHFSSADLILLRNSLLTVFQDSHKRVSDTSEHTVTTCVASAGVCVFEE